MSKWEVIPLVELTTKLGDGLHGTPKYDDSGDYFFVNGNNLNNGVIEIYENTKKVNEDEFHKYKKILNDRTILVSINGTLGKVAFYNNEKIILGKSACYFNLKEGIDKNYIKYFITCPFFIEYADEQATGSTIKNVSLKSMRNLPVPLPPLPTQKQIVAKLDALFERIDKSIALLEENIKHTQDLMASVLDEEFGRLEKYSQVVTINDIADVKGGKRLPKGKHLLDEKSEYPYIRVTDFTDNGTVDLHNIKYVTEDIYNEISRYIVSSDDLYISIAGTIGKTGIIPKELDGANLTENAARLVYKNKNSIFNKFIYYYTISNKFKNQILDATKQVAMPKLALTRLKKVKLALPSFQEQVKFVRKFEEIELHSFNLITQQSEKLDYLKSLKSSLLDMAFKGELVK